MKCGNCGYEIVKPNLKTCPLCGYKLAPGDTLSEEGHGLSEQTSVETVPHGNVETELPVTRDVQPRRDVDTVSGETSSAPSHDTPRHENAASYDNPPVPDDTVCRVPPMAKNNSVECPAPQPDNHYPQKDVTPEDPDQYVENGSYQPYTDEVEEGGYDDDRVKQPESRSSVWVIPLGAAIAGLIIGSILYFVMG